MSLASIGDAIVFANKAGKISFANAVAAELSGWKASEVVGKELHEFLVMNEENPSQATLLRSAADPLLVEFNSSPLDDGPSGSLMVFRDASAKQAEAIHREHLAAIIDSSDDVIASKDLNGIITSWNKGAERVLGYSAAEAIGRHVSFMVPEDSLEDVNRILGRISAGESVEHYETKRRRKDGTLIDVSLTVSPIRDATGQIVGASKIGRDITEAKRAQKALAEARRAAEKASHLKDEFLAILSHELRTPLGAILGWAQILEMEGISKADHDEGVQTISRNARVQAQLIDDLLDISRIVTGKLRLEKKRTNPQEPIEAALNSVELVAQAKSIRLERVIESNLGEISADQQRIQQTVWNLLTNAIKFTPAHGVIQVSARRIDGQVEVKVVDSGCGIPADFLPFVFDRFRQADSSSTRSHGGLGLGLSLVKQITELHGGTVQASSPGDGKGASFVIRLPLLEPSHDEAPKAEKSATGDHSLSDGDRLDLSGLKILIVDDEADSCRVASKIIASCGAEVQTAYSADEGLRAFTEFHPDILLSDIGMPGKDGYQLLRSIRALRPEEGGLVPAIALTAFARSEDRRKALLAGFLSHIVKPAEPAELIAVVASLVGRTGGQQSPRGT